MASAKAFMSDRDSYLRGRADWLSSYANESGAAVTEARRILETAEPQLTETHYSNVRWIGELVLTLVDDADALTRYGAALAESLAAFTAADEPAAWLAERQ